MFPSIKTRFHTQKLYQDIVRKQQSLILKPKTDFQSNIRSSLPYLNEVKRSSLNKKKQKNLSTPKNKQYKTLNTSLQHSTDTTLVPEEYSQPHKPTPSYSKKLKANLFSSKLQHVLKYFSKQKQSLEVSSIKPRSPLRDNKRYDFIEQEYKTLSKKKYKWTLQSLTPFIELLMEVNPFYKKLNIIIALCLLKVGKIQIYEQNQIIQRQDDPITEFGIVLWGEVLLRCSWSKIKLYLFPGDSLNEEILFPNQDKKNYEKILSKKGLPAIQQSAKAKTKTGILFLNLGQYQQIFREMVNIGEKTNILIAENMMKWSYAKKKGLRKQFSKI